MFGLSMREGYSVCKDQNGFIWASFKTGILRLTDDDYRKYTLSTETVDYMIIKLVYNNSRLFAYTDNGQIFQFNPIHDKFELLINLRKELKSNYLYLSSIFIDGEKIWMASSNGLFKYHKNHLLLIGNNQSDPTKLSNFDQQHIFVAEQQEVRILNTIESSYEYTFNIDERDISDISCLYYVEKDKLLWIGTLADGLYKYDVITRTCEKVNENGIPEQPILAIETNSDSTIFLGIDGQGVWELNTSTKQIITIYKESINNPSSLRGNGVYNIFNDDNKRIWVSTYSNGVSYFEKTSPLIENIEHQINNPNSLINNNVNSILEDRNGKIWMATNNGISTWNIQNNKWENIFNRQISAQVFLTLCEDKFGRIWAGTYSDGVYIIDALSGKQIKHFSTKDVNSPLSSDFVLDIFEDAENNLWIGGVRGLVSEYKVDKNVFKNYGGAPVNAITQLSSNEILLACTYGLSVIIKDESRISIILNGHVVNDVCLVNDTIWACTSGDGLLRLIRSSGEITKFRSEDGLPSNHINSIVRDSIFLWLGTENGICRFSLKDHSVETYNSIHNVSNFSYNRNANCRLNDGRIAWGTNSGVVIFDPKNLRQVRAQGKIFIQDITISGRSIRDNSLFKLEKPIDQLEELKLNYNQNTVTLEVLQIGVSPGTKFSWMLEGLDESWSKPSAQRIITYSNIPNKKCKLKIRLYDSSLSQLISEKTLAINIKPPFWSTWYFFVIVMLILSGLIYLSLWYYISLLRQKHTEEKVRFFTNTAHDLRTSLTLIKAPVDELSKEKNISELGLYHLNLAREQTGRLTSVITQLMDFQKVDIGKGQLVLNKSNVVDLISNRIRMFDSYAESREIQLEFETNLPTYDTAINEEMIEKILDNLISNAVKYSKPDSKVHVEFTGSDKQWQLKVIDQGIGISKKAQKHLFKEFYRGENAINTKIVGSGIGLLLVQNYVAIHNGEVKYSSNEESGSIFTIVIPKKEISAAERITSNQKEKHKLNRNDGLPEINKIPKLTLQQDGMNILVVEDNDDLRNFMAQVLGQDFSIKEAKNGEEAWPIVQKELPDLVVSDVMMPIMDGFELCQKVKSTYETAHIPVILLTAISGKTEQLHGLGLGADDYLTKPFDITLLQQKIKSIILNRQKVRNSLLGLGTHENNEPNLKNEFNEQFLEKMLAVVNENIRNNKFNKDVFAAAMNVSSSLLYKKVKSLTDHSPTDFIKIVRLKHAQELLKSGEHNITEISELCGFSSVSYFSTVFKKQFGKPPINFNTLNN
ncbi:MAG: two-component regulator propeller domain-containing protein [Prolixibacteraceae bacterium]